MKIRVVFLWLAVLLAPYSFVFGQAAPVTEQLVLTTYYLSPTGSYSELQLFPKAGATAVCNDTKIGTMFYDSTLSKVRVCKGTALGWQDFGNWTVSADGTKLYTNNNAWNVGIGINNPAERLDVNGNIKVNGNVLMGWEVNKITGDLPSGEGRWVTVDCSDTVNKRVLGGGCWTNGTSQGGLPKNDNTGWRCNYDVWVGHRSHVSTAICANIGN